MGSPVNLITSKAAKNYLINGNFDFWQRNTTFTNTTNIYTADRWYNWYNNMTITRQSITDLAGSRYCMRWAPAVGSTQANLSQAIEEAETRRLVGKKLTLSFYVRKGPAFDGTLVLYIGSNSGSEAKNLESGDLLSGTDVTSQVQAAPTWTRIVVTTTNPVLVTARSITLSIEHRDIVTGGANNYLEIAQVQLHEAGPSGEENAPDDFVYAAKTTAEELLLCQRFFEKSYDIDTPIDTLTSAGNFQYISQGSNSEQRHWVFKVNKRAVPAMALKDPVTGTAGQVDRARNVNAGAQVFLAAENVGQHGFGTQTAATAGNIIRFHWTADAEL